MTSDFTKSKQWNLLIIPDPQALPGKNIYDLTIHLLKVINIKYVLLADVEGAGPFHLLNESEPVLKIQKFLNVVQLVKQFDWGDFFLFNDYPENWKEDLKKLDYPEIVSLTETTIRAIDDTYIYIYTPYNEVVRTIRQNYTIESIKNGELRDLDYPY